MKNLQKEFDKWCVKNNLDTNLKFTEEQNKAFEKGKKIFIQKDNDEVFLQKSPNGIMVTFAMKIESAKKVLSTSDMIRLLDDKPLLRLESTNGKVENIENGNLILKNENGEFKIPISESLKDVKIGDNISVKLNLLNLKKGDLEGSVNEYQKVDKAEHSEILYKYDVDSKTINSIEPSKVLNSLYKVNGQTLTEDQKRKLKEGDEIDLEDGEKLRIGTNKDSNWIDSNSKKIFIASMLLDGGMSYFFMKLASSYEKKTLKNNESEKNIKTEINPYFSPKAKEAMKNAVDDLNEEIKKEPNKKKEEEVENIKKEIVKEEILKTDYNKVNVNVYSENEKISLGEINLNSLKDILIEKGLNKKNIIIETTNKENLPLLKIVMPKNDLLYSNKEMFDLYIESKKPDGMNFNDEKIEKIVEFSKDIKLNEKLKEVTHNNLKNFLENIRSILSQKSRAYPTEKGILRDINILSNNISKLNGISPSKTASATGTNDPDMLEDAKAKKEQIEKESIEESRSESKRSRRM